MAESIVQKLVLFVAIIKVQDNRKSWKFPALSRRRSIGHSARSVRRRHQSPSRCPRGPCVAAQTQPPSVIGHRGVSVGGASVPT